MSEPTLPIATAGQTWALMRKELRGRPGLVAATLAVSVAAAAAGLVAPWVLGTLVDDIAAGAQRGDLVRPIVVLGVAAVVAGLLTGVAAFGVARLGQGVLAGLRERVLDRALGLPSTTLERVGTGDLVSRVGDDVSVAARMFTSTGPETVQALLTIVLTAGGLFALDWRLGLAGLTALPMYALAVRWYLPRSGPFYTRERAAVARRTQALAGSLHGRRTVRGYLLEQQHVEQTEARSAETVALSYGVFKLYTRFASRLNRAEFVGLTAVLLAGFFAVRADLVTIGATTAAALYFHRLFNPIGLLVLQFDSIQSAGASLARLAGVLELPGPAEGRRAAPAGAALELAGVTHRYDEDGPEALREVSARVDAGERVALVGASGAGKSTLAAIAAGVLVPTAGTVRLGGVELGAIGESGTRARIALLSQEVHVFAGPLRDDLRLARPDAGDDDLRAALDTVAATNWVKALPDGLDTNVGEGGHQLTAAQAQQLALARLVLADPPVAILDEATAEADSTGARTLERAAAAATEGRTTLIVAHRLSQARSADRVIVLDDGVVVETGSHDELLAAGGPYSELWHSWTGQPA